MNINEAKEQIKMAVSIYLQKDEHGKYRIPQERQRPVFMIGAPGIGKTAVVEQIAQEMDIAIVSYSMTHHTRQSALGLPIIKHRKYGEKEYDVSEYTMSEIIASIYETMERTKKTEGILFLDEINCVSETLAPSMLLFLQYKMFGRHRVPDGWVVVTAGNPPQFNRSVREFDIVTLDRMKVIEVDADYDAWRTYAVNVGIHTSIITYLDIKTNDFYLIESTIDGKSYVTARGWENLSEAIYLHEEMNFPVDESLIGQYIRNKKIAREFASYYELYIKYRQDYHIEQILSGNTDRSVKERVRKAGFDERVSLMGLLLSAIQSDIRRVVTLEDELKILYPRLKKIKELFSGRISREQCFDALEYEAEMAEKTLESGRIAGSVSEAEESVMLSVIKVIREYKDMLNLNSVAESDEAFALIKEDFDSRVSLMRAENDKVRSRLDNLFDFVERELSDDNEMLILITDLTINSSSAHFISTNGCDKYFKYNSKYQLHERGKLLLKKADQLEVGGNAL